MTKIISKWLTYIMSLWVFICIAYIIYILIKEIGFVLTCLDIIIVSIMYKIGLWYKNYIGWYTKPYYSIIWMPILVLLISYILIIAILMIIKF